MKITPPSSQGFTDSSASRHEKLNRSKVTKENDALAKAGSDKSPPLHRKEDLTQGDEGVDDPEPLGG